MRNMPERLKASNAVDFDDIILLTVQLLQNFEDVRRYYQRKFRYVLIDEYQDTNHLQYLLASLLAGGHENICVVGDDDQSIYRFRGATIRNILDFENEYHGAKVIRLEQNYRSTQSILDAANAVIKHNTGRKGKQLWTNNGVGDKILHYEALSEQDEANFVANQILSRRARAAIAILRSSIARTPSRTRSKPPSSATACPTASSAARASLTAPRSRTCWPISASSTTAPTICASSASSISRRAASARRPSRASSVCAPRRARRFTA